MYVAANPHPEKNRVHSSRLDVAVLEAGIETQLRPNLTLGASYSGQFGDGLEDHGSKASLIWNF
jgi:outer membrane autotransporter protein